MFQVTADLFCIKPDYNLSLTLTKCLNITIKTVSVLLLLPEGIVLQKQIPMKYVISKHLNDRFSFNI